MGRTSSKREEILCFLTKFAAENGYAPSVREICAAVGLQSTATVHYHLNALRQDGLIEMDGMKKRTITLADSHRADRIPVVGVVTAGVPILAVENIEGYLPWDGEAGCFALRVRGDSMMAPGFSTETELSFALSRLRTTERLSLHCLGIPQRSSVSARTETRSGFCRKTRRISPSTAIMPKSLVRSRL